MPLRTDLIEKNKKKNQEDQEHGKISPSTRERQTSNVETAYDRRKRLADLLTQRGFETTLPEENKTETALDRRKELAVLLTKAGYQTKLPERKTKDELFIGGSERASQLPVYEVPEQKARFILPSNIPRTQKNSPTTSVSEKETVNEKAKDFWGNDLFGSSNLSISGKSNAGFGSFGTSQNNRTYMATVGMPKQQTEEEIMDAALDLVMEQNKVPVLVRDAAGNAITSTAGVGLDALRNEIEQETLDVPEQQMPDQLTVEPSDENKNVPLSYKAGAVGRALKNSVYNYLANATYTLDALRNTAPDYYGVDVYQEVRDGLNSAMGGIAQRAQRDLDEGYISEFTAQTIDTGVRMLMDAVVFAAGGATVSGAGAVASAGKSAVSDAILKTVQNPAFYSSWVQQMGSAYNEYLQQGIDPEKARIVAAGISAVNSVIEVQGGSERLIADIVSKVPLSSNKEFIRQYFVNALEEATEELIQAPVSNLGASLTYDPDIRVLNPEEMLGNAGAAFLSSLALGAVGTAARKPVNAAIQYLSTQDEGRQAIKYDNLGTLMRVANISEDEEVASIRTEINNALRSGKKRCNNQFGGVNKTCADSGQYTECNQRQCTNQQPVRRRDQRN